MATRPVFIPCAEGKTLVRTEQVEFHWFAGLAVSQKQKSIEALHQAACKHHALSRVLEISSKSPLPQGVALSAFNLSFTTLRPAMTMTVECAFQGSKVFSAGGPFPDLFEASSLAAKRDPRLQSSGRLTAFRYFGTDWPLEPRTAFYDWLYLNALVKNPQLSEQLSAFDGFSDIEFNPQKSINCQAYAAALFVALQQRGQLHEAIRDRDHFLACLQGQRVSNAHQDETVQASLF